MKKILMGFLVSAVTVAPMAASAMVKVTNLSPLPQTVVFDSAGTQTTRVIAPQRTESFAGADGLLSIKTATPAPQPQGGLASDGMLSGIVGAARTNNIPASQMDSFVIWPDGKMMRQMRKKNYGGGRR